MGIRYYKLFDLLNRKHMKKTDLLEIMSSRTLAKLSKGEYVNLEVIDKICAFLNCQPYDIMEHVETIKNEYSNEEYEVANYNYAFGIDKEFPILENVYTKNGKKIDEENVEEEILLKGKNFSIGLGPKEEE